MYRTVARRSTSFARHFGLRIRRPGQPQCHSAPIRMDAEHSVVVKPRPEPIAARLSFVGSIVSRFSAMRATRERFSAACPARARLRSSPNPMPAVASQSARAPSRSAHARRAPGPSFPRDRPQRNVSSMSSRRFFWFSFTASTESAPISPSPRKVHRPAPRFRPKSPHHFAVAVGAAKCSCPHPGWGLQSWLNSRRVPPCRAGLNISDRMDY